MPLDLDSFPIRLFRKSRDLDWDPLAIDMSREAEDWASLTDDERWMLLRHVDGFYIGERGVTHDLAALQQCFRGERGRMQDEMYLTAQLYEESRHIEFFEIWMEAALQGRMGIDVPYPEFPATNLDPEDFVMAKLYRRFQSLHDDPSPENQTRAIVLYHMIVEGVLAETGYHLYYDMMDACRGLKALRQGITLIQRDESRHVAFGIYLLQRLISEQPSLEAVMEEEMQVHRQSSTQGTDQAFIGFDQPYPFGLDPQKYRDLAHRLFESRLEAVKRGTLVEI